MSAEHTITEASGGPGSPVFDMRWGLYFVRPNNVHLWWAHIVMCHVCLYGSIKYVMSENIRNLESSKELAKSRAWGQFLNTIPWDCDVAVIESVVNQ